MNRPAFVLVEIALLSVFAGICGACAGLPGRSGASTPTRIVPAAGQGGLTGQIQQAASLWPDQPVIVYAATFQGDAKSGGIYVLEPSIHPQTTLSADGSFQLNNLVPGSYVLVAGPDAEDARAVVDDHQTARVIEVKPNQVLDLGQLQLAH